MPANEEARMVTTAPPKPHRQPRNKKLSCVLRAPNGVEYPVVSIRRFVHTNTHLFDPADVQWSINLHVVGASKMCRAVSGLGALLRGARNGERPMWKGWAVSEIEKVPSALRQPAPNYKKGIEHNNAVKGVLKSPDGKLYTFCNVSQFVRDNLHLFEPEDVVWKKYRSSNTPTCRALGGLLCVVALNGKSPSWKGWTLHERIGKPNLINKTQPTQKTKHKTV